VDLKERLLKGILRQRTVAAQSDQESDEIIVVTLDERLKGRRLARAVRLQQLLIVPLF
jgi:hypothetical protein